MGYVGILLQNTQSHILSGKGDYKPCDSDGLEGLSLEHHVSALGSEGYLDLAALSVHILRFPGVLFWDPYNKE